MKAMILAAGLGTRLRPYSAHTPKPLFPVDGEPLIDRIVRQLARAGVEAVMVNTHHLHERMVRHFEGRRFAVPVSLIHEPEILGTGGALRNVAAFWGAETLLVINADVVTDIDLRAVAAAHERRQAAATLACIDHPAVNTVLIDPGGRILGFAPDDRCDGNAAARRLTFTGVQVISPVFRKFLPAAGAGSSIDAYRAMIRAGLPVMAWDAGTAQWIDTGTPARYRSAVLSRLIPKAFEAAAGCRPAADAVDCRPLAGDGSDRRWYRLSHDGRHLIMADHGIRETADGVTEADAFIRIAHHLHACGVPVPRLYAACAFSGILLMEDAGDVHLQDDVIGAASDTAVMQRYRRVIDALVHMAITGRDGFDTGWTWQTPRYDRVLILEKECRYFMDAFVRGAAGVDADIDALLPEFTALADAALAHGVTGLMHRDFQSRNILVRGADIRIIDFAGARIGPLQYDLAALLHDPYVDLPAPMVAALLAYAADRTAAATRIEPAAFTAGFQLLSLCRLMQALGAYGHLWRVKGKAAFRTYIPVALARLQRLLAAHRAPALPRLTALVDALSSRQRAPWAAADTRRTPCHPSPS